MLISSQKTPGIMSLAEKPTQENLNVTSKNFLRKKKKWIIQKDKDTKVKKKGDIVRHLNTFFFVNTLQNISLKRHMLYGFHT